MLNCNSPNSKEEGFLRLPDAPPERLVCTSVTAKSQITRRVAAKELSRPATRLGRGGNRLEVREEAD